MESLYLDLLMSSLLGELYADDKARLLEVPVEEYRRLAREGRFPGDRLEACTFQHTLIGRRRLENVARCLNEIVRQRVPGDLIECGVWRGGTAIFMRGFLADRGIANRTVWVADSFCGPPPPSLPQDQSEDLSAAVCPMLAVSLETVRTNFARYRLLDQQVRFLPGWFRDTLPGAPIRALALLRIDGDLYESTRDALAALYDTVSPGGFVIVDDYGCIPACREAVDDFRREHGIAEALIPIDWTGVYWRRNQPATASRLLAMMRRKSGV